MKKLIIILVLILSAYCIASNEIHIGYTVSNNLYFRVFNAAGKVWNTALGTPAFETWADGNVTDYDVALVGTGGSFYVGTFPATMADGTFSVIAYLRAGGAPAVADGVLSGASIFWIDGAETTLATLLVDLGMPTTMAGKAQR